MGSQKESRANFRFCFSEKLVFGVGTSVFFVVYKGKPKGKPRDFSIFFRQNLFLELVPPFFLWFIRGSQKESRANFRFFLAKLVFGVGTPRVFCGL